MEITEQVHNIIEYIIAWVGLILIVSLPISIIANLVDPEESRPITYWFLLLLGGALVVFFSCAVGSFLILFEMAYNTIF